MAAQKLLAAIAVGTGVLFLLELTRWLIESVIVRRFCTDHYIEVQFWPPFVVNLIFCVLLPATVYAALYQILPFSGYHSGFFIALFVFGVGTLPVQIRSYNQFKLSTGLVAFQLFWNLLTLLLVIGSITYIYQY